MFSFFFWSPVKWRRDRERVGGKRKKERRLMTVSNRTSGRNRSQTSLAGRAGASAAFVPTWTNRRPSELVHRCSLLLASESKEIHQYIHTLDRQSYFIIILSMRLIRSDRKHSKKFSSRKLCPMKRGNSSASSRGRRLPLAPCNQSIIDTKKRKGQEVLKVDGRVRGAIIP